MRVSVLAVGRAAKDAAEMRLYRDYVERLRWPVALVEIEERRRLPPAALKDSEARLLLDRVPAGATLVALDPRGTALTSEAFAVRLGRWRDSGVGDLAFAIGGADGLGESVTARAALALSLGPMTWPHLLVRAMLAEQLWRASAILSGHPYHRA